MVGVERRHKTVCRVQETINRLGVWLVKCEYRVEGTPGTGVVGQSRPWVQGTEDFEYVMGTSTQGKGTRGAKYHVGIVTVPGSAANRPL